MRQSEIYIMLHCIEAHNCVDIHSKYMHITVSTSFKLDQVVTASCLKGFAVSKMLILLLRLQPS